MHCCCYQYVIYLEYIKGSAYLSIINQVSLFYTLEKNQIGDFSSPSAYGLSTSLTQSKQWTQLKDQFLLAASTFFWKAKISQSLMGQITKRKKAGQFSSDYRSPSNLSSLSTKRTALFLRSFSAFTLVQCSESPSSSPSPAAARTMLSSDEPNGRSQCLDWHCQEASFCLLSAVLYFVGWLNSLISKESPRRSEAERATGAKNTSAEELLGGNMQFSIQVFVCNCSKIAMLFYFQVPL